MKKLFIPALAIGLSLSSFSVAEAHHNTVSCIRPGVWLIVNSEADKAETYTTNQGHSGTIPAGGSVEVAFSGNSLTVFGTWENGVTNTNTGEGNCTDNPTTTENPTTTTIQETTTSEVTSSTTSTTSIVQTTTTTSVPIVAISTTIVSSTTSESSTIPSTTQPLIPPVTGSRPNQTVQTLPATA